MGSIMGCSAAPWWPKSVTALGSEVAPIWGHGGSNFGAQREGGGGGWGGEKDRGRGRNTERGMENRGGGRDGGREKEREGMERDKVVIERER